MRQANLGDLFGIVRRLLGRLTVSSLCLRSLVSRAGRKHSEGASRNQYEYSGRGGGRSSRAADLCLGQFN